VVGFSENLPFSHMFYFAGDVGSAGYGNARSRQHHDLFGKIIEVCGFFRIFLASQIHILSPRSWNSQSDEGS
jgi:hypothetical protein